MKIKISRHGNLYIERAGKMREQYCLTGARYTDGLIRNCGDWCPAFGEPVKLHDQFDDLHLIELRLCREADFVSCAPKDFTDERGHDNDQT